MQETAQLLGGEDMPNEVLACLLTGADVGSVVGVLNLTPYDSCLEKSILKKKNSDPGHQWRSLSLSTDLTVCQFAEQSVALHLLEDISPQKVHSVHILILSDFTNHNTDNESN